MDLNIKDLMEQAKKLEAEMAMSQSKMADIVSIGAAGADMVTAKVNGLGEVLEIAISDELFDSADKKMLEDLVVAAINNALGQSQAEMKKEFGNIASMFKNIPNFPPIGL